MNYKSGITVVSLVIYIILLFGFTSLALAVSSNLNSSVYDDKGLAINLSNYDKLQYYLNKSAIKSNEVETTNTMLTFSNGDTYSFESSSGIIYYNDGILCDNVDSFTISSTSVQEINIAVTLIKYSNEMQRNIALYVGE